MPLASEVRFIREEFRAVSELALGVDERYRLDSGNAPHRLVVCGHSMAPTWGLGKCVFAVAVRPRHQDGVGAAITDPSHHRGEVASVVGE